MSNMKVIKSYSNDNSRVSIDAINDERLSWRALGIYVYICTKPEGWKVTITELSEFRDNGRDAVRDAINELLEYGYLERRQLSKKDHRRLPLVDWSKLRTAIFERDNYTCIYCGQHGGRLECDHVTPISRGGSNEPDNLVTSCKPCNREKRDKTLEEWLK